MANFSPSQAAHPVLAHYALIPATGPAGRDCVPKVCGDHFHAPTRHRATVAASAAFSMLARTRNKNCVQTPAPACTGL
eukprot:3011219-Pleurochrysis_carterae.AAC.1